MDAALGDQRDPGREASQEHRFVEPAVSRAQHTHGFVGDLISITYGTISYQALGDSDVMVPDGISGRLLITPVASRTVFALKTSCFVVTANPVASLSIEITSDIWTIAPQ